MKKLSQAIVAATALTAGIAGVQTANAVEVSASAAVANMYLWRGQDLGHGAAAVSGDITVSEGGAYAGVWASSGDTAAGQEYDLYVGYGGEAGALSYDLSVLSYVYPGKDASGDDPEGTTGALTDVILSLGYEGLSGAYYYGVGSDNDEDYSYATLGYGVDAYSLTVGFAEDPNAAVIGDYTHVDIGYAYNDSLGFTLSKIVDSDDDTVDDDLKVVVSYSLPIE